MRLPTEWEWQQAATGGDERNEYPWGAKWGGRRANTYESGLGRTTAVGMYPQGASPVGALDMSGNVCEWCLNAYEEPERTDTSGELGRAARGGSWSVNQDDARCADRDRDLPYGLSSTSVFGWSVLAPLFPSSVLCCSGLCPLRGVWGSPPQGASPAARRLLRFLLRGL